MSKEITIFLVGYNEEDAMEKLCFDSYESARDFQNDNPGMFIYSAQAVVDPTTIEREI